MFVAVSNGQLYLFPPGILREVLGEKHRFANQWRDELNVKLFCFFCYPQNRVVPGVQRDTKFSPMHRQQGFCLQINGCLCRFFGQHVYVMPGEVVLSAFQYSNIKRSVFFANGFHVRSVAGYRRLKTYYRNRFAARNPTIAFDFSEDHGPKNGAPERRSTGSRRAMRWTDANLIP